MNTDQAIERPQQQLAERVKAPRRHEFTDPSKNFGMRCRKCGVGQPFAEPGEECPSPN